MTKNSIMEPNDEVVERQKLVDVETEEDVTTSAPKSATATPASPVTVPKINIKSISSGETTRSRNSASCSIDRTITSDKLGGVGGVGGGGSVSGGVNGSGSVTGAGQSTSKITYINERRPRPHLHGTADEKFEFKSRPRKLLKDTDSNSLNSITLLSSEYIINNNHHNHDNKNNNDDDDDSAADNNKSNKQKYTTTSLNQQTVGYTTTAAIHTAGAQQHAYFDKNAGGGGGGGEGAGGGAGFSEGAVGTGADASVFNINNFNLNIASSNSNSNSFGTNTSNSSNSSTSSSRAGGVSLNGGHKNNQTNPINIISNTAAAAATTSNNIQQQQRRKTSGSLTINSAQHTAAVSVSAGYPGLISSLNTTNNNNNNNNSTTASALLSDKFDQRPIKHHSFVSEVPDVKHMERALLGLLDDFHSGKLKAFGSGCTMDQMTKIREQQESLAKLHFELAAAEEDSLENGNDFNAAKAQENMLQLMQRLEQLSISIEQLQTSHTGL